jgi:hypothetical protein
MCLGVGITSRLVWTWISQMSPNPSLFYKMFKSKFLLWQIKKKKVDQIPFITIFINFLMPLWPLLLSVLCHPGSDSLHIWWFTYLTLESIGGKESIFFSLKILKKLKLNNTYSVGAKTLWLVIWDLEIIKRESKRDWDLRE